MIVMILLNKFIAFTIFVISLLGFSEVVANPVIVKQTYTIEVIGGDTLQILPEYLKITGALNENDLQIICEEGDNYTILSDDKIIVNSNYSGEVGINLYVKEGLASSNTYVFKITVINQQILKFNNSNFENGNTDSWSVRNELQHSIETTGVIEGNYAIKLWFADSIGGRMRTKGTTNFNIRKDYLYEFVFYAKVNKDSTNLDAALTHGGNDPLDGQLQNFKLTTEWQRFSYQVTGHDNTTYGATFNNFKKGFEYYIDNVYLIEYPQVSPPTKISDAYVSSENGDDTNNGSIGAPFKTITKAINSVSQGGSVYLREGFYHEKVEIDDLMGTESVPFEITNYNNEEVVLDGSVPITGNWQVHEGQIMKIQLDRDIQQLWVNSKMMTAARWPNVEGNFTDEFNFEYSARDPEPGTSWHIDACFVNMDIPYNHLEDGKAFWRSIGTGSQSLASTNIDFSGAMVALKMGYETVAEEISKHSEGSDYFQTTIANEGEIAKWGNKQKFYITSHLACLDQPGEWYFDLDSKILYLWPKENLDLEQVEVKAKVQKLAITINKSSNITIKGLKFFGTTMTALNSENLLIEDCSFDYPSYVPWMLKEKYSQFGLMYFSPARVTIRNCEFRYFDGTGIVLNGNEVATPVLENCLFRNSRFDHMVRFANCKGAVATRNTLYLSERGNGFKFYKSPQGHFHANLNYMHNLATHRSDASCIQVQSGSQEYAVLSNNWFHDTENKGIRFDGEPAGRLGTMFANVGWNLWQGLQVKGDFQTVVNNTFFDCSKRCDITVLSDDRFGGNKNSRVFNNAAERLSGHRVRDINEYPLECENGNNWNGFETNKDISTILRDPFNLDFRPVAESPLIDAGTMLENVTVQEKIGDNYDIGAYEYGDINYWIPGRKEDKASMPVPPNGTLSAHPNCDLMWLGAYNGSSHKVYLGTKPDNMELVAEQETNIYFTEGLDANTIYFWRVDEIVNGKTSSGDVWYFVTNGTKTDSTKLPLTYLEDFNKSDDDANFDPWDENIWDHTLMTEDSTYVVNDELIIWPATNRVGLDNKFRLTGINMILRPHPLMGFKYKTPKGTGNLKLAINVVSKDKEGTPVYFELPATNDSTFLDTVINIAKVFEEWDKANVNETWGHLEHFDIWFYPTENSFNIKDSLVVDNFKLGYSCIDFEMCQLKIIGQKEMRALPEFPLFIDFTDLKMKLEYHSTADSYEFDVVDLDALPGKARMSGLGGNGYEFTNQVLFLEDTTLTEVTVPVQVQSGNLQTQWYNLKVNYNPVGVSEITNEIIIDIYPNPVRDFITISNYNLLEQIEVIDFTGRKVLQTSVFSNKIDLSELNAGVYVCLLHLKSGRLLQQIGRAHV